MVLFKHFRFSPAVTSRAAIPSFAAVSFAASFCSGELHGLNSLQLCGSAADPSLQSLQRRSVLTAAFAARPPQRCRPPLSTVHQSSPLKRAALGLCLLTFSPSGSTQLQSFAANSSI